MQYFGGEISGEETFWATQVRTREIIKDNLKNTGL
jgi:hypothetical protein